MEVKAKVISDSFFNHFGLFQFLCKHTRQGQLRRRKLRVPGVFGAAKKLFGEKREV